MKKLFGTDGVRGLANKGLTPEMAMDIGMAGAYVLSKDKKAKVLIGSDTRLSSDMLEGALLAGLCAMGAEVYKAGVVPSPAMAHLVRHYKMDAGVMLSASHNPMEDNGIKFFDSKGYKLPDEVEEEIETLISKKETIPRPIGADIGRAYSLEEGLAEYENFLVSTIKGDKPLSGLKVALDCANGATYKAAPEVFARLGAEVITMYNKPDGVNINDGCGSTHLGPLQAYVKANKVDIGLAFDGDGDRVLCVDNLGEELDGDAIMAICGLNMKNKGQLKNNTIVATVMSNLGLELFCKENSITLLRTAVGDRYVLQEMLAGGFNIGGEQSGHIILSDNNSTGDGTLTGLQLASILKENAKPLSELRKVMQSLPQVLLAARGKLEGSLKDNKTIASAIQEVENKLATTGRVLVRPSGTEPVVRVMMEGQNKDEIQKLAEDLTAIIQKEMK